MDWVAFEDELVAGVVAKVTERADQGGRLYGAVLGELYAETDGVIRLPMLGAQSEEELAGDEDIRWSLADWSTQWDMWLPEERWLHWEQALTTEAGRSTTRHWERTFTKYLSLLARVCKRSRNQLREAGVTDRHFVVVVLTDDEDEEKLLRRVLSKSELCRLFPCYDQAAVWTAAVASKAPADRAAAYVQVLGDRDAPVSREDAERALHELGEDALPPLLDPLSQGPHRWMAAKVLAEIGNSSAEVIDALTAALKVTSTPDIWVAAALSRLGRLDAVLSDPMLPTSTVVAAVVAPYRSFRNAAVAPPPLDYRPLARFLDDRPELNETVAEELRPGSGYCIIRPDEVATALEALDSPHPVVRWHAASVLGERALGTTVGRQVVPHLATRATDDPDPLVRRLAILSLACWKRQAEPYTDIAHQALQDPDATVRSVARYWLDQRNH